MKVLFAFIALSAIFTTLVVASPAAPIVGAYVEDVQPDPATAGPPGPPGYPHTS